MNRTTRLYAFTALAVILTSCSKNDDPIVVVPPSDGSTLTLNGIAGSEPGTSAANAVYVDFSKDAALNINRDSWDLGFYTGSEFKVILNAGNASSAKKIDKNDLNQVTPADITPSALVAYQGSGTLDLIDDPTKPSILTRTVIDAVSATDADNEVYIINRKGASTTVLASELYKVRILRKNNGYTLQYAKLSETTFKTIDIVKDPLYNFQGVSFLTGKVQTAEPEKASWDLVWGYSMFYTGTLPYPFSDLVFINNLAGVQGAEVLTSTVTYADFSASHVAAVNFSADRAVIGSNWRVTNPAASAGVKTDRFYVLKDASGNVYKLKFVSFIENDGGTRGKPVIEYKPVK